MRKIAVLFGCLLIVGCAGHPHAPSPAAHDLAAPTTSLGMQAASLASTLVGAPYRFGGITPEGFDCSGLVYYVFKQLGVPVPRTAQEHRGRARPVSKDMLQPGDLLFFYTPKDHVGIYLGGEEFVHAPTTGRLVTRARMNSPFFILGFEGAGRFP